MRKRIFILPAMFSALMPLIVSAPAYAKSGPSYPITDTWGSIIAIVLGAVVMLITIGFALKSEGGTWELVKIVIVGIIGLIVIESLVTAFTGSPVPPPF